MNSKSLRISVWLWFRLILQLRRRGNGERESGAFLLSKNGSHRITRFLCYDDLDPQALEAGIIVFHGVGFVPLWDLCRRDNLRVVADIHTHGDNCTSQSEADRTHPMIGQKGHVGLIAPYFAQRNLFTLNGVGLYEYIGNHQWNKHETGLVRLHLW